jgi:hypothetical protein
MPAKREILNRPRRPRFRPEAVELFAELESVPKHRRDYEWKGEVKRLTMMFDDEIHNGWLAGCWLTSDEPVPFQPDKDFYRKWWLKVRTTRAALLAEAAKLRQ